MKSQMKQIRGGGRWLIYLVMLEDNESMNIWFPQVPLCQFCVAMQKNSHTGGKQWFGDCGASKALRPRGVVLWWRCVTETLWVLHAQSLGNQFVATSKWSRGRRQPSWWRGWLVWWLWRPHHMSYIISTLIKPFSAPSCPLDGVTLTSWKRPPPPSAQKLSMTP